MHTKNKRARINTENIATSLRFIPSQMFRWLTWTGRVGWGRRGVGGGCSVVHIRNKKKTKNKTKTPDARIKCFQLNRAGRGRSGEEGEETNASTFLRLIYVILLH